MYNKRMLKNKKVVKALTIGLAALMATPTMTAYAQEENPNPEENLIPEEKYGDMDIKSDNESQIAVANSKVEDAQVKEKEVEAEAESYIKADDTTNWNDDLTKIADTENNDTLVLDSANEFDEAASKHLEDELDILHTAEEKLTGDENKAGLLDELDEKIADYNDEFDNVEVEAAKAAAELLKVDDALKASETATTNEALADLVKTAEEATALAQKYSDDAAKSLADAKAAYDLASDKYEEALKVAKEANEAADAARDLSKEDAKDALLKAEAAKAKADSLKASMEEEFIKIQNLQKCFDANKADQDVLNSDEASEEEKDAAIINILGRLAANNSEYGVPADATISKVDGEFGLSNGLFKAVTNDGAKFFTYAFDANGELNIICCDENATTVPGETKAVDPTVSDALSEDEFNELKNTLTEGEYYVETISTEALFKVTETKDILREHNKEYDVDGQKGWIYGPGNVVLDAMYFKGSNGWNWYVKSGDEWIQIHTFNNNSQGDKLRPENIHIFAKTVVKENITESEAEQYSDDAKYSVEKIADGKTEYVVTSDVASEQKDSLEDAEALKDELGDLYLHTEEKLVTVGEDVYKKAAISKKEAQGCTMDNVERKDGADFGFENWDYTFDFGGKRYSESMGNLYWGVNPNTGAIVKDSDPDSWWYFDTWSQKWKLAPGNNNGSGYAQRVKIREVTYFDTEETVNPTQYWDVVNDIKVSSKEEKTVYVVYSKNTTTSDPTTEYSFKTGDGKAIVNYGDKLNEYVIKQRMSAELALNAEEARKAAEEALNKVKEIANSNLGIDALKKAYEELQNFEKQYDEASKKAEDAKKDAEKAKEELEELKNKKIDEKKPGDDIPGEEPGDEIPGGPSDEIPDGPTGGTDETPAAPAANPAGGAAAVVAAPANGGEIVTIETPETALAATVEEAAPVDVVTIDMPETAKAPEVMDMEHLSFWWLILVTILGGTGWAIYRRHQEKKEEKITK